MDTFCTYCGTRLVNGVCPNCSGKQPTPQNQQPPQPQQAAQQYQPVTVDPNDDRFKGFFMSPNEKFVCALGNGYLMNFLAGGYIGNGFAVISDKRVYFKGKSYEVRSNKLSVNTVASVVDLKDVTGTEVKSFRHIGLHNSGVICLVVGATMGILSASEVARGRGRPIFYLALLIGIIMAIYGLVVVCTVKPVSEALLTIMFGGGGIAFPISWYPTQECESFQRMLRIAKDQAVGQAENPVSQPAVTTADELAKYAQLYKDGLLSDKEFADIKARLLNNK